MIAAALMVLPIAVPAPAFAFPDRPIELIVPWGPGGGADQLARLVARLMEPQIEKSVPVVNVPGATGATGMAKLLASPADGYTMAVYIADSHALLVDTAPRWSLADIVPVAIMLQAPSFLFLPVSSAYSDWRDFEKAARANPGTLRIATLGFGSVDDLSIRVIESTGLRFVQVPNARPGQRYSSVLNGEAHALYEQAGDVRSMLDSRQIRPMLIFGDKRSPDFPEVPSAFELGYKVKLPQFRALVVRADTPAERLSYLRETLAKVAASPEFKKFLADQLAKPDSFISGEQASRYLSEQLEEMRSIATRK